MTLKNKNYAVLYVIWVVVMLLSILSLSYIAYDYDNFVINSNNILYKKWNGRYEYYYYNNVSQQCLFRCWRDYGIEANATGNKNNCVCDGFKIHFFNEISSGVWDKPAKIENIIINGD